MARLNIDNHLRYCRRMLNRHTGIKQPRFHRAGAADDIVSSCYGKIAKTRAGNPDPPFGFGKLTTAIAPASGT